MSMYVYTFTFYVCIYILLSSISVSFSKRDDPLLILAFADDHSPFVKWTDIHLPLKWKDSCLILNTLLAKCLGT